MPNIYPTKVPFDGNFHSPMLFIAEAPGEMEVALEKPLVGPTGQIFTNCLERNGFNRDQVALGNVSLYRPKGNKFNNLLGSLELQESIDNLHDHIDKYKDNINVICAMGNYSLSELVGVEKIMHWRGSILPYRFDNSIKVVPTVHPAFIAYTGSYYPIFDQDIKKVIRESKFKEFNLPKVNYHIPKDDTEAYEFASILRNSEVISCDIETVKGTRKIICVGFANNIIDGYSFEFDRYFDVIESILMTNNNKVFQNGIFDTLQLYINGLVFNDPQRELQRFYHFDTMVAQHVAEPELPKSLGFLSSIYTRHPNYKSSGREELPDANEEKEWSSSAVKNKNQLQKILEYNCTDVVVTYEVYLAQRKELIDEYDIDTFNWEMEMLSIAFDMSMAGLLVDNERRDLLLDTLEQDIYQNQAYLNALGVADEKNINVKSPKQIKELLYEELKLPVKKRRGSITTDEDALVSLIAFCKDKYQSYKTEEKKKEWEIKLRIVELILKIRQKRQLTQFLRIKINDADNRARSTVNICGTETGRFSMSKFVDSSGTNLHTTPRDYIEVAILEAAISERPTDA